ncbi:MAG: hypothetical protein ABSB84_14040 [Verrucomicrobiota bacterium]|jgi:hypothetical protein
MNHQWKFFRAGGFDQVKLQSGSDLANLDQLDQKLWVALACPTTGLEFDAKTLELIDTDKDGRIRAPELIAAAQWACSCLKNPDDLLKPSPALSLSAINDATPFGKQLLSSARQILTNLGKQDATAITVEDTADTTKIFAQTNFNGDGIVPADAAGDAATRAVIADIIACLGPETDRSGKPGVSQAKVDQFFAEAQAYSDWWKNAEGNTKILPLGEKTPAATAAVKAVKAKVDDYFARCRLAAFDPRATGALNREEKEYVAFAAKDLTITAAEIAGLPLARIEANKPLPLKEGVNPAWAALLATLQSDAVKPLLGDRSSLSESDWAALTARLGPYECWTAGKAGVAVEKLGLKRVREILTGKSREAIMALIAKDKALEPEANAIANVERLVRYHRDLFKLCNNFVSFRDFYGRKDKAIFQAGTLYLDQRSCDLCLTVDDAGKHAAMAGMAGTYLAYCDCVRKGSGEKLSIVAAFTGGDSDNLMVGRNGIFYDRKGLDYDATITKLLDNPISVRQAFWSPYKKLVRMIEERAAKQAAAADADVNAQLTATAQTTGTPSAPAAPQKLAFDPSVIALISLALGTLAAAFAGLLGFLGKFEAWQVPLVIIGIMLVISAPSMAIAWLKLRKRNLGPILDANGWAVNAKAKMNVPFGGALTGVAALPPGATFGAADEYAEKPAIWPKLLLVAFVVWFVWAFLNDSQGRLYRWTDGKYGKTPVEVQKALDAKAAEKKGAEVKGKTAPDASAVAAPTNAPAK